MGSMGRKGRRRRGGCGRLLGRSLGGRGQVGGDGLGEELGNEAFCGWMDTAVAVTRYPLSRYDL